MTLLILAAMLWLAIHLGLSGTSLRGTVAGVIGEKAFAGVFSLLALVAMVLLVLAYRGAHTTSLWFAPPWLVLVVDVAMLAALILLAAGVMPPRGPGEGARGVFRITRHPVMVALGLWAAAHLLASGNTAALVFFGSLLITVVLGLPSIDGKLARRDPAKAAALHSATSIVPFAAILAGRNRLALGEIGWWPLLAGAVAWGAIAHVLHPWLFGVPALPVW